MAKVGVYVCHCGSNIAGVIDVEAVRAFAETLPDVVIARKDLFMCSDSGQEQIKQDIRDGLVDRVVVAACTPRTHEPIFRAACEAGGLNKYLFEMANIRDQASWVHPHDPEGATEKAKLVVASAVGKAKFLQPLEDKFVNVTDAAMVVGGGVGGIFAALELANMGHKTYLVEKEPSIGGIMAMLDKTFPTNDCSACILTPVMVDAAAHPNIEVMTYSEVVGLDGYIGNFTVKVNRKQSYVDWNKCTGCGACAEACPAKAGDEFNQGLNDRPAAYIQFPQAVPKKAVIDMESCINCAGRKIGSEPKVSKKTGQPMLAPCEKACPADAINRSLAHDPAGSIEEVNVGSIVVATGYKVMEKESFKEMAPESPNVVTALQLERIISATGPTGGKLLRPSDNKKPKTINFVSCVGSRDEKHHTHCSRVCCMYMIKQARLIKEKYPDINIYMHFIDVRTAGKDYDEYYTGARKMGINILRGKVGGMEILPDDRVRVLGFDMDQQEPVEIESDLVVLATAIELPKSATTLGQTLGLQFCGSGFFRELHPKLGPVETSTRGLYLAGCCQGPKDIPDTVSQAKGAAAAAAVPLAQGRVKIEPILSEVQPEKCSGCGICVPLCPYNAISLKEWGERPRAEIDITQCKGCGVCTTACPSSAIRLHGYEEDQIMAQIAALTS
ncbi:CoB--CoM heterodisulfide reductase iron-sulfur subunit A family protein [Salidesulfovibrio onnuriiensis]|uniref:CoB--CoM heterodisulfide reductase iron-sulfur subunit A family protein n=1 Tax=Salidesulfovibrio onnuriiensis TaxID=2583823 RepID=UPI0011C88658|nr:CoB--CoM heterodisulfide reductase iron-sulfur subunit A family protein [Salidesulfovibrio onnuriiensis]